jgi:serine/threonine-protein kinase RsbW
MAEMMDPPAPRGKPAGRPARAPEERAPEERAFEARMEVLPSTAAFVAAFCGRNGIGTTDTLRLTLVVEELFTNIVTHGYGEEGVGMIRLRLAFDGRDVMLVCRDEAPPYDPRPALRRLPADLDEPVDKRGVGGLGNLLVGRLVDVSDYVRAGSANVLTLRFRRDASRSS